MIELNEIGGLFGAYPDGESLFMVDRFQEAHANRHRFTEPNVILLRYESDLDLIQLMLLKRVLDIKDGVQVHLRLSHVPYARMDRSPWGSDHSFSLKAIAEFVNWLHFDQVVLFDPHSDVSAALFDRSVELSLMDSLMRKVWTQLDEMATEQSGVLSEGPRYCVFPDAGAQKKYERFLPVYGMKDFLIGLKHRDFDTGRIESVQILSTDSSLTLPARSSAIIIDDLCSYGGTFIKTAEILRGQFGFDNVYLVVAHCEFSARKGELWRHIDHMFTTDSMVDSHIENAGFSFITRYTQTQLIKES